MTDRPRLYLAWSRDWVISRRPPPPFDPSTNALLLDPQTVMAAVELEDFKRQAGELQNGTV